MQRPAGDALMGALQGAWNSADKALGGWLPGGGTPNALTRREGSSATATRVNRAGARERPWSGRPGQFAEKGSFQNGLDAINKAGASPMGFLSGNANDLALVRSFYKENPEVANQYDLPVNMFMRYASGIGNRDLQIGQNQGARIIEAIRSGRGDTPEALQEMRRFMSPEYMASLERGISQGKIPVVRNSHDREVDNSLGRFWAEPQEDGSYTITDKFDFAYAPKNKGGDNKRAGMQRVLANPLSLDPVSQATRLVSSGQGEPFQYRLNVQPNGEVRVLGIE